MNITQKVVNVLSTVSEELHDLTLEAVFSKQLIDEDKSQTIGSIKSNISKASDELNEVIVIGDDTMVALDNVVRECMSSLHEINSSMKQELISQNAEEDYAELSAQIVCLHEQIERIKNS
jgi:hypothetical protein